MTSRRIPGAPTLTLLALAFAGIAASFMQTILIPIQGTLPDLVDAPASDTAWAVTVTVLVAAVTTPVAGRLGDMFGRRRVALLLLGILIVGSVLGAVASTLPTLIVGRALQGTALGVIPLGISILRDQMPPTRLPTAIAIMSATLAAGGALGLPLSGAVAELADWHMLFWIAAAIGAIGVIAIWRWVPGDTAAAGGRIDGLGIAGLAIGITGLLVALSKGGEWGWTAWPTLATASLGLLTLAGWIVYELRTREPLIDLRSTARPAVLLTNLASVAMGFALFASNVVLPRLLEMPVAAGGAGLSLIVAGLVLMPAGLVNLAIAPLAGRMQLRFGPRIVLIVGALVMAAGYLIAACLPHWSASSILCVVLLLGAGVGLGFSAIPALILRAVPAAESGAANGFNALMRSIGLAAAAAIVAAVLAGSMTSSEGVAVPTPEALRIALVMRLIASGLCAALAALVPTERRHVER